ncbi:MAG: TRAP transporter substrate-binding protein, partial [Thermodesulfobacteriota bacterium]|nr:TRAP transporter substrate-binding protein [Thermodesulfobacteriota bacterium]
MPLKRILLIALVAAFGLSALPVVSPAGQIKLRYSNFFPPTHVQSRLAEAWCKEVEKGTNGRVAVEYYPGETLTKAPQCYDGVVEGLSDIGLSVLAYSRGRFPVMAAIDLPLGYTSGVVATKVANSVYDKFKPKEFNDSEVMYFHAHGPGLVHTAKKPVKKLEDMRGLKLRATGNSAKVVKAMAGTPVAMSMPDSYQSIQKGVVDGGVYPVETNKGWNMGEVVDYCTESFSAAYTTTFFVVMNKDKWESLPRDVQATIREINAEWVDKHGRAWDESDVVGRKFFLELGNKFIALDK